jgi:hypothetical protein
MKFEFVTDIHKRHVSKKKGCGRALDQIYITWDGSVTACCVDWFGEKDQTLQEIYSSKEYVQFREDHVNDQHNNWAVCRNCRERQ